MVYDAYGLNKFKLDCVTGNDFYNPLSDMFLSASILFLTSDKLFDIPLSAKF